MSPIRFPIRMYKPNAIRKAVYPSLCGPIISRLWPSMKPCAPSKMCCNAPGRSTERRERTRKNTLTRNKNTRICMATELVIGAWGWCGGRCSAFSTAVTGPAKIRFRSAVNQSCSIDEFSAFSLECAQFSAIHRDLNTTRQGYVSFVGGFARDGAHGQEQARQKSVEARGRNSQYNIGG